jgi:hypothetical protein
LLCVLSTRSKLKHSFSSKHKLLKNLDFSLTPILRTGRQFTHNPVHDPPCERLPPPCRLLLHFRPLWTRLHTPHMSPTTAPELLPMAGDVTASPRLLTSQQTGSLTHRPPLPMLHHRCPLPPTGQPNSRTGWTVHSRVARYTPGDRSPNYFSIFNTSTIHPLQ